jgi:hypothetical protein
LDFWKKKKKEKKNEIHKRIKLKRKREESKKKRVKGGKPKKEGIRVWGDKGRGERKRKGLFFGDWMAMLKKETDWFSSRSWEASAHLFEW